MVNLRGEIREKIEVIVDDNDGKKALEAVFKILDELTSKNFSPIVAIGVGAPQLTDSQEGVVINAVNLDWHDLKLGKLLEKKYSIPVSILNDSQASAIGEYVYNGNHDQEENYIVVNINQGIGAGILINGRLFQGDGGGAGEIGHVVAIENGELCRCGKRGCLETISSMRAIMRQIKQSSVEEAIIAFAENDPQTRAVVLKAGRYLGISLANMIGGLNIRKIILTGDVVRFGEDWFNIVKSSMEEASLSIMSEDKTKLAGLGMMPVCWEQQHSCCSMIILFYIQKITEQSCIWGLCHTLPPLDPNFMPAVRLTVNFGRMCNLVASKSVQM